MNRRGLTSIVAGALALAAFTAVPSTASASAGSQEDATIYCNAVLVFLQSRNNPVQYVDRYAGGASGYCPGATVTTSHIEFSTNAAGSDTRLGAYAYAATTPQYTYGAYCHYALAQVYGSAPTEAPAYDFKTDVKCGDLTDIVVDPPGART